VQAGWAARDAGIHWFLLLCHACSCHLVLCRGMLYHLILHHGMLCYIVLRRAMLWYVMVYRATSCYVNTQMMLCMQLCMQSPIYAKFGY